MQSRSLPGKKSKSARRGNRPAVQGASAAALTAMQKRQVRDMMRGRAEVKALDVDYAAQVTTAGTVVKLTSVAQGVSHVQRVGDALFRKDMDILYSITVGATGLIAAADQYNTVRVLIFEWLEDDGLVAPTVANVLDTGLVTIKTLAQYNWDTKHLYRILYDRQHVVFNQPVWNGAAIQWAHGEDGTFATPSPITIGLNGRIDFDADATVGKGHVYALLISDSAFTPNPAIEFVSRFRFTDE